MDSYVGYVFFFLVGWQWLSYSTYFASGILGELGL